MEKVSYEDFYKAGITQLRNPKLSKGIHLPFSGFNAQLKQYYGDNIDPREVTNRLVSEGKIEIKPVKGGVMIYLPGEGPRQKPYQMFDLPQPAKKQNPFDVNDLIRDMKKAGSSRPLDNKKIDSKISDDLYNKLMKDNEAIKKQMAIDYEIGRQRSAGAGEMHKKSPDIIYLRKKRKLLKSKAKRKKCSCRKK